MSAHVPLRGGTDPQTRTVMSMQTYPETAPIELQSEALWQNIEAALGGPAAHSRTLVMPHPDMDRQIIVVVVQPDPLPADRCIRARLDLTPREVEVARLMAERLTSREIAERLDIALNTARRYCERILVKLGIHSRSEVRETLMNLQPLHLSAVG